MQLKIKDLEFKFNKNYVFEKFNLDLSENNTTLIIGNSGSGKTTLIYLILNLYKVSNGNIEILDYELKRRSKISSTFYKDITICFQNTQDQIFNLTVYDDIMYAAKNFKIESEIIHSRLKILLDKFGLSQSILNSDPLNLSGGELKKVAIIETLILHPKILVLDEPSAMMDYTSKFEIFDFIKSYCSSNCIKLIIVTHDVDLIDYFKGEIVKLEHGNLKFKGAYEEFVNYCVENNKTEYLTSLQYFKYKLKFKSLSKYEELKCLI